MKFNLLCRKFRALAIADRERELSDREQSFLSAHRCACSECLEWEESMMGSLAFLQSATLEPLPLDDDFTWRVARRSRLVQQRDSLRYWSPAFMGATVACLVLLAALQLAARSNPMNATPTAAQRKTERGFQVSRTSVDGASYGSDANDFRREDGSEGPLLLVHPKTRQARDFEP